MLDHKVFPSAWHSGCASLGLLASARSSVLKCTCTCLMICGVQVCKAGVARLRKIWLTRHGESEYNLAGKLGGDSRLGPRGEAYARLLPDVIVDRIPLVRGAVSLVKDDCHSTSEQAVIRWSWITAKVTLELSKQRLRTDACILGLCRVTL
jgi:hypothetical protein